MTRADNWFYRMPEKRPYLISERVNNTFWAARVVGLYLKTERAEPPFRMTGTYNGAAVSLEWEPAKWLRLSTCPASEGLMTGTTTVLERKPVLRYETPEGETVWEWWLGDFAARWQELQGKPAFRNPARLDASR